MYILWLVKRFFNILFFQNDKHPKFVKIFNSHKIGQIIIMKIEEKNKVGIVQIFQADGKINQIVTKYDKNQDGIKQRDSYFKKFNLCDFEYIIDQLSKED